MTSNATFKLAKLMTVHVNNATICDTAMDWYSYLGGDWTPWMSKKLIEKKLSRAAEFYLTSKLLGYKEVENSLSYQIIKGLI